jgi:hypothetical protein
MRFFHSAVTSLLLSLSLRRYAFLFLFGYALLFLFICGVVWGCGSWTGLLEWCCWPRPYLPVLPFSLSLSTRKLLEGHVQIMHLSLKEGYYQGFSCLIQDTACRNCWNSELLTGLTWC